MYPCTTWVRPLSEKEQHQLPGSGVYEIVWSTKELRLRRDDHVPDDSELTQFASNSMIMTDELFWRLSDSCAHNNVFIWARLKNCGPIAF